MLTIYLDESFNAKNGMCIVAGYLGKQKCWNKYVKAWKDARGTDRPLHLDKMRLAAKGAPKKYKDLLKRLALIPKDCGLKPFAGSICEQDYKYLVSGTVLEVIMPGYVLAILALMDGLFTHLRSDERVNVIFEQQVIYADQRERAMILWNSLPKHRISNGKPVVVKWSSIEKCALTEASDYFCYAMCQRDTDRSSQKAILTAPILDAQRYVRNHYRKETVEGWLKEIAAKRSIPTLTAENKKLIRPRIAH